MYSVLNKSIVALAILISTTSCQEENSKKVEVEKEKKGLSYSDSNTKLEWTAFKTTDKIGVKGTFNSIIIENNAKASSVEDIISSTSFKIATSTVFTGNEGRDILLEKYFFDAMMNTDTIYGKFLSSKNGKGQVSIKMNNIENKSKFSYVFTNDTLTINTVILLDNWKGESAIESLNNVCLDKHTGPDGVTKTWSDVDLKIVSVIK